VQQLEQRARVVEADERDPAARGQLDIIGARPLIRSPLSRPIRAAAISS
jgi:hypothetical protein